MADTEILHAIDNKVLTITLNRPAKKNAITDVMYVEITALLRRADADDNIHIIVFRGSGDAFCGGTDISVFTENKKRDQVHPAVDFVTALSEIRKPVIAAVHGVAVGVGATMLFHFDIILAAEGARFRLPFVDFGMLPDAVSSLLLPATVGYFRAARMLMEADFVDAAYMAQIGIVTEVTAPEDLHESAERLAISLAQKSNDALCTTKRLLRHSPSEIRDRASLEFREMARIMADREKFKKGFDDYSARI